MQLFYHIPEHRISLVQARQWESAAHGAYWVLRPWVPRLGIRPSSSSLSDVLTPAFGYSIAVYALAPWKRVGNSAVALIYVQGFTTESSDVR
jgi:hypothetical protein